MSTAIQRSMTAGEIAPELGARADQVRYATGLRTCKNFYIRRSGGASNRAGTEYVAEVRDSNKTVRFIEFKFNNDQTYVLEFGDYYMRVIRRGGQIAIDTSVVSNYDPTIIYGPLEIVKMGNYIEFPTDPSDGRVLWVVAPYGASTAGLTVALQTNTSDNLAVAISGGGTVATIKLADTTASKNYASLIQAALRASHANFASMTVIEDFGGLTTGIQASGMTPTAATAFTAHQKFYSCSLDTVGGVAELPGVLTDVAVSRNINYFPPTKNRVSGADLWDPDPTIYEIATPYPEAELPNIRFAQSADVITLTLKGYPVMNLSRNGHADWALEEAIHNPEISQPDGGTASGTAGGTRQKYRLTAVSAENDEESLPGFGAAKTITAITQASPGVVTSAGHGFENGDEVYITGVVGMTQVNDRRFVVANKAANTFELTDPDTGANINTSGYNAYSSGGTARQTFVAIGSITAPAAGTPITVTIPQVTGAREYNIYRAINGVYGFIGVASGTSFSDVGATPDTTDTPPEDQELFQSTDDYPACVGYSQQRRFFANSTNDPEKGWGSRVGKFSNFTRSRPLQDDDSVDFIVAGNQVNAVQHLLELGKLLVFTSGGEISIQGDAEGIIRPLGINPKQHSYNGTDFLRPLVANGSALYVQARGSVVRDLQFRLDEDGYKGDDLTLWASHLIDGYSIVDWAYQQIPHSIVWLARDDGKLLGMTYVRDQQILAWHQHDLGGIVENVCVVPEDSEDVLYLCVKRTIDGATKRYIERVSTRNIQDLREAVLTDCSLSYDGRNTDATHTMTLTGSGWTYQDTLTLTSSAAYFAAGDVGKNMHLRLTGERLLRCVVTAYTSATVVSVRPLDQDVPASMRAVALSDWGKAIKVLSGLDHLEGEDLSVLADGHVAASPNNPEFDVLTVTAGAITIDEPAEVINAGLPITADLQTLDLESVQGETLADKNMLIGRLTLFLQESRGVYAGPQPPEESLKYDSANPDPLLGLDLLRSRGRDGAEDEDYLEPASLISGKVQLPIGNKWNNNGRVFIRQVDPLPLTVLAIAPAGIIPVRG